MTELFSLGELYVSDFLAPDEQPRAAPVDLTLVMDDDTKLVHLAEQPPAELMWGRYWYRSGTNQSMRNELNGIVDEIEAVVPPGGLWVDIASNDGTLLAAVNPEFTVVGVDPVEGDIYETAVSLGDEIIQAPFTSAVADDIVSRHGERASVVTCIAMFYDLLDPTDFLEGVHRLLADDGVFVVQMSYTPLMLRQLAFDNIVHEHARYYTLTTLRDTLMQAGFRIVDATLNDTNGGSFRVYAMRDDADVRKFGTQPYRDVAEMRTHALLYNEEGWFNTPDVWLQFAHRVDSLRNTVREFIVTARNRGETVSGIGASTKGNTLLQYFGLDHTLIDSIGERQPGKVGLRTVGTDISIVSEDDMRKAKPDYLLMLPWHFRREMVEREADYLAAGGKLIVPLPVFEVVGR